MGVIKEILRANVFALLQHERPFEGRETSGVSRLMQRTGTSLGNAQRILKGETSVGVDLVEEVASKLGLQPWQLLVTGLDPADPPVAVRKSHASGWPFESFGRDRIAALTERERGMVEAAARFELERIERTRPRPAADQVVQPVVTSSPEGRLFTEREFRSALQDTVAVLAKPERREAVMQGALARFGLQVDDSLPSTSAPSRTDPPARRRTVTRAATKTRG